MGIEKAKEAFKRRMEDLLAVSNRQRMWQRLQHITNCRGSSSSRTVKPKVSGTEELTASLVVPRLTGWCSYTRLSPTPACNDISSVFNAIIPDILVSKLLHLDLLLSIYTWMKDFLVNLLSH